MNSLGKSITLVTLVADLFVEARDAASRTSSTGYLILVNKITFKAGKACLVRVARGTVLKSTELALLVFG